MIEKIKRFFALNDFNSKAVALGLVLGLLLPLLLYLASRLLALLGLDWNPLVWILLCWAVAGLVLGSALVLKVVEASVVRGTSEHPHSGGQIPGGAAAVECPHCGFSPLPSGARTCPNCGLMIR